MSKIEMHPDGWWKIEGDTAFDSILEGYPEYEKIVKDYIGDGSGTAIQAGGYCGIFSKSLSYLFKTVYTFEPDAANFICLAMNISDRPNVIAMRSFLGSYHRVQGIQNLVSTNRGMNVGIPNGNIPTLKIDDIAAESVRYIQLDTEGSELEILNGASDTISEFRPLISVEDDNDEIRILMKRLGYKNLTTVYRDTFYVWS
jgi:FkbM family methyltransferase